MLLKLFKKKKPKKVRQKMITIAHLGRIELCRHARARRMIIRVTAADQIKVVIPPGLSFTRAEQILCQQQHQVHHLLNNLKKKESRATLLPSFTDETEKRQAAEFLKQRTRELAGQYGFSYNKISVRSQKTRWGSCSFQNNINLNIHLYRLPRHLADYVILHELLHTRIHRHGSDFWQQLNVLKPDLKNCRQELRQYRLP
jgi:predicted metal-dependent hydrolase